MMAGKNIAKPVLPFLTTPAVDRFWSKVSKKGDEGCWLWLAWKSNGYGKFTLAGRSVQAHRVSYVLVNGEPPEGLVIDHLCRNRGCVNPRHLEAVTNKENAMRGVLGAHMTARAKEQTHCKRGHEYTPENTYRNATSGRRNCRTCLKEWRQAYMPQWRAKRRAA